MSLCTCIQGISFRADESIIERYPNLKEGCHCEERPESDEAIPFGFIEKFSSRTKEIASSG